MIRRFLPAAAIVLFALSGAAQTHPNTAKGFNANNVYQFNSLDSINDGDRK